MDRAEEINDSGSLTSYEMFLAKDGKKCISEEYKKAMKVGRVVVSSLKMDDEYWKKVSFSLLLHNAIHLV